MQFQAEQSPKYDKVFVGLGVFHIELAAFGIIGKYFAESGGLHILNETYI